MWTGVEALSTIDQSLHQLRRQLQEVDQQVQAANRQLVEVRQTKTRRFVELAQLRLDRLAGGEVSAGLDETDRRVTALLAARDQELKELEEKLAENERLEERLESEREAQRVRVNEVLHTLDAAEAKTQQRLQADAQYQHNLKAAQQADSVAREAEAKTAQAEADRAGKGAPYESDPLFMYLWRRGYGTARYHASAPVRLLDGWVARLCGFQAARPNYWMLLEIPVRLQEHARRLREHAGALLEPVKEQERAASEADGIPQIASQLQSAQQALAALDDQIRDAEVQYRTFAEQRAAYAAGKDDSMQRCLASLAAQLEQEPLSSLRRHAEATPAPGDDAVVQELSDLEVREDRMDETLERHRQLYERHLARVKELEEVRREFKTNDFDDFTSVFTNEALITMMLNQFLRGMAGGADVWGTVRGNHRRRRAASSPTFGSGGFGRSTGGGWRMPSFPSGGGGRSSGGGGIGGGGFRTTGGF